MFKLDATEWMVARHQLRVKPMHHIPSTRHVAHTQVSLAQPLLHARALLQRLIEPVDTLSVNEMHRECAQVGAILHAIAQNQLERALILVTGALRNLFPRWRSLVPLDQPLQRTEAGAEVDVFGFAPPGAPGV